MMLAEKSGWHRTAMVADRRAIADRAASLWECLYRYSYRCAHILPDALHIIALAGQRLSALCLMLGAFVLITVLRLGRRWRGFIVHALMTIGSQRL